MRDSPALALEEQQRLVSNLGDRDGLILENHVTLVVGRTVARHTYAQWTADGQDREGDAEWPALLRRLDRLSPGYRD